MCDTIQLVIWFIIVAGDIETNPGLRSYLRHQKEFLNVRIAISASLHRLNLVLGLATVHTANLIEYHFGVLPLQS